jgi:hypothetical protein
MERYLPSSTNMFGIVQNGRNIDYATISVVKQSEENSSEKLLGATFVVDGLANITVIDIRVVDIELMRDALHSRKPFITRTDRVGDGSPPFIGSGPIGGDDHVPPSPVGSALSEKDNLVSVLIGIDGDHILVLHTHRKVLWSKTWFVTRGFGSYADF